MRVLIVEDNTFNAFCLCSLLESIMDFVDVTVVPNSSFALSLLKKHTMDLVIIDGNLNAVSNGLDCDGPELAHRILQKYPHLPLVSWSDSVIMKQKFIEVFSRHQKPCNENSLWPKAVNKECILNTWLYYFDGCRVQPKNRSIATNLNYY